MDRDFLVDYKYREDEYYTRFVEDICNRKFVIGKDESPYKNRYVNLQRPVTELNRSNENKFKETMWAQIPFSGSSIIALPAFSKVDFEEQFFDTRDIPKIVDFIKETGRLQFALPDYILDYEGLDFLDPIFLELKPPAYHLTPMGAFASDEEIRNAINEFTTVAEINFTKFLDFRKAEGVPLRNLVSAYVGAQMTFVTLKLTKNSLAREAEKLLVDDPVQAIRLLALANIFIEIPAFNLLVNSFNFPMDRIKEAELYPVNVHPKNIQFEHEIGKFLLTKLTYAPQGLDACKEIMYRYDKNDLRKVQKSLNQSIVENNPQAVNSSAIELSEILGNVWDDKTIPLRIKGLKIGLPLSMAAIGSVAAGPIGTASGLLAGLGFDVLNQMIDLKTDGLSEKLAKIKTKSYQANIYDFKAKYKDRMVLDRPT